MKDLSRRKFIGQASCAAVGYSTLLSSLINLKSTNAAAIANSSVGQGGDYKAMVCIMLGGGNDSFNMLVPNTNSEYNDYRNARGQMAIARNQLLNINPTNTGGQTFGLHPAMSELQSLFNNKKAAFVNNIGTLVVPTTRNEFLTDSVPLPLGLLSHSDQMAHWQTGMPHTRTANGWGGRVADLINDMNSNDRISMNVSLSGSNLFQKGNNTIEYAIDPIEGAIGINEYDNQEWLFHTLKKKAVDDLFEKNYQDIFKKSYAGTVLNARDAHIEFSNAISNAHEFATEFDADDYNVGQSMEMIARTISIRNEIGMNRQIFYVNFDGWDHHDELLNAQNDQLGILSKSIGSFQAAMEEIGLDENVTTFIISDFARTLTSNGNGTDHGWGGNVFAVGGGVDGGKMFGEYPSLRLNGNDDLGGGIILPTTSADLYMAELSNWFGVSKTDLNLLYPNLSNFYDTSSSNAPLGFMKNI